MKNCNFFEHARKRAPYLLFLFLLIFYHSWGMPASGTKCFLSSGDASCERLSNQDLECTIPLNDSSCVDVGNINPYGFFYDCALSVEVNLAENGSLEKVEYIAEPSRAISFTGGSEYQVEYVNDASRKRTFTQNCNRGCCNDKIVISSIYLHYVPEQPKPVRCYSCTEMYKTPHTCTVAANSTCEVPKDCQLVQNERANFGCELTIIVIGDMVFYSAQGNIRMLPQDKSSKCVAVLDGTPPTDANGTYSKKCVCDTDECNQRITFS